MANGKEASTKLKEAFQCISNEEPQKAIDLIKELTKEDLENSYLGVAGKFHLFDWAMSQRQLEVADAIIKQYAVLTDEEFERKLKPLAIDYEEMDSNTQQYNLNNVGCMDFDSLTFYKDLVDEQKEQYLKGIQEETKKLRIMGIEKLLKITKDPEKKQELSDALKSYKEDTFPDTKRLNQAIKAALNPQPKESTSYEKAIAAINTANKVDDACNKFGKQSHYSHQPLKKFEDNVKEILADRSNDILKESRGFGETLARIGNAVARYTGIGYVVAAAKGKFQEFHEYKWTLFSEKTKSEEQKENIASSLNSPKSGG